MDETRIYGWRHNAVPGERPLLLATIPGAQLVAAGEQVTYPEQTTQMPGSNAPMRETECSCGHTFHNHFLDNVTVATVRCPKCGQHWDCPRIKSEEAKP